MLIAQVVSPTTGPDRRTESTRADSLAVGRCKQYSGQALRAAALPWSTPLGTCAKSQNGLGRLGSRHEARGARMGASIRTRN
jgi:hypothetical protein